MIPANYVELLYCAWDHLCIDQSCKNKARRQFLEWMHAIMVMKRISCQRFYLFFFRLLKVSGWFYSVQLRWTYLSILDVVLMEIPVESLLPCSSHQYGAADAKQIRHYINFVFSCTSHNNYNKTNHNPDQFIVSDTRGTSDIHSRSWKGQYPLQLFCITTLSWSSFKRETSSLFRTQLKPLSGIQLVGQ